MKHLKTHIIGSVLLSWFILLITLALIHFQIIVPHYEATDNAVLGAKLGSIGIMLYRVVDFALPPIMISFLFSAFCLGFPIKTWRNTSYFPIRFGSAISHFYPLFFMLWLLRTPTAAIAVKESAVQSIIGFLFHNPALTIIAYQSILMLFIMVVPFLFAITVFAYLHAPEIMPEAVKTKNKALLRSTERRIRRYLITEMSLILLPLLIVIFIAIARL